MFSSRVGNNGIAYFHTMTKIKRAISRNKNMLHAEKEDIINLNGKQFPVAFAIIDTSRLTHSFEAIARAIYYHEFGEIFSGICNLVVSDIFINPKDETSTNFILRSVKLIEDDQYQWNTEMKGANPKVFTYQFSNIDGFGSMTLALNFYERTKVYVILSLLSREEFDKLKLKFKPLTNIYFGDIF